MAHLFNSGRRCVPSLGSLALASVRHAPAIYRNNVALTADGWPVIAVKSNGKEMPRGTGPFGSYMLLLRKNGADYYTRTFQKEQAIRGVRLDLAVGALVDEKDHLTVAVENLIPKTNKKTIRLSNRLVVPPPPKTAKNLTVPIPGRDGEVNP